MEERQHIVIYAESLKAQFLNQTASLSLIDMKLEVPFFKQPV
jgi:hypothetical protein